MKKIFYSFFFIVVIIGLTSILILSTIGLETDKFNTLISSKIKKTNNNINVSLKKIKFKIDVKQLSLFLETEKPILNFRETSVPIRNIKAYIDFKSFLQKETKIKKVSLVLDKINTAQLKKISSSFKPSNLTSYINNKIKDGDFNSEIEIYFNSENKFDNFIAKGTVSNLKTDLIDQLTLEKTSFSFFADRSDILLKNITGKTNFVEIFEGDLKIDLSSGITLNSNFKSKINYSKNFKENFEQFDNLKLIQNFNKLEAALNNNLSIQFDKTLKVKKYSYKSDGNINKAIIDLNNDKEKRVDFLNLKVNKLSFENTKINTTFDTFKNEINLVGKYSLEDRKFLDFDLSSSLKKELMSLKLNMIYDKNIELSLINFKKDENIPAKIFLNLEKFKDRVKIKEFNYAEKNNNILVKNLKFREKSFYSLEKISIKTKNGSSVSNDFTVLFGDKILIKGQYFDASQLSKVLKDNTNSKILLNLTKDIEIDFANIVVPLSERLKNFKLIGKIEKGKFIKINSKGNFGNNNFLDISLKNSKKDNKKYLEVYSDLTKPLLTEYNFFKGLTGGKLLYTSIIDDNYSSSNLKIENFKVINAPGMVKLLSLADLGGLADLAEGEGISFDTLEIKMQKTKQILKLNEILALGPSISVLMEGYQDPNVTSIKGTLIPAKTLNKMISKIPVIGDIVIPKEVGEGLFGISFKMKGPPGKIKTTINPIKTLTPRFIQKIIDKNKIPK